MYKVIWSSVVTFIGSKEECELHILESKKGNPSFSGYIIMA